MPHVLLRPLTAGVSDENGVECLLKPVSNTNHLAMFAPKGVGSCSKEAGNAVSGQGSTVHCAAVQ